MKRATARNSVLVTINVVGLAIAVAASLLIVFYVQHETSYDRHWPDAERVYRLNNNFDLPGRAPYRLATTSSLLVPAMQEAFADEIETAARARTMSITYRVGVERFQDLVVAVDPSFNYLFPLELVGGSLPATLGNTTGIALSEAMARRLFGTVDALDHTLTIEYPSSTHDYRVTAVYRMPERSSVLELPALIRFDEALEPAWRAASLGTWYHAPVASYIKLKPGVNADAVRARLDSVSDANVDVAPMSPGPDTKASDRLFFDMSNIVDLHLDANFQNVRDSGNRGTVQIFGVIAALILLIACTNFAYLLLAQSGSKAAEVGVRKILGAGKGQLLLQYLGQSAFVVGMAVIIGLVLVELMAPFLAGLLGIVLRIDYGSFATYANIAAVYVLVTLLGGLYPALALSRLRPALALRFSRVRHADVLLSFRNLSLVFQFGVAIALIVATAVIYLQVEFVSRRDPGFRQDKLLFVTDLLGRQEVDANKQVLRERIAALPGVVDASLTSYHPLSTTTAARLSSAHRLEGGGDESFILATAFVDAHYVTTYGLALVAGRGFSADRDVSMPGTETAPRTAMINAAAARFLGFADPAQAIGKFIRSADPGQTDRGYEIVGVVSDNQFYSLKAVTRPEIYFLSPALADVLAVRYEGDAAELMDAVQGTWRSLMGDAVLTSHFVEPLLAREFAQERGEGRMLIVFSLFSIFIAWLGLYGAALNTVNERTREIAIRKVMGAEIHQVVMLLLWQFSRPVLFANLMAWPVALWGMLAWLQRFPFRIDALLLIPLCVLAGSMALLITWLTVAGNTMRVASANPVCALRYE
ncbi:MAG: ABC transporter permease [Gammaproteobacteria bacterium]